MRKISKNTVSKIMAQGRSALRREIQDMQLKYEPQCVELFYQKSMHMAVQKDNLYGLALVFRDAIKNHCKCVTVDLQGDLEQQQAKVRELAAEGKLTATEIKALMDSIHSQARTLEVVQLAKELEEIKERLKLHEVNADRDRTIDACSYTDED